MYVDKKSVIIIDDVSTTGSTISECARALKKAGAKEVYALTLARAPLTSQ
jgi:predicted amidophosphoribosyltransferase